MDLHLKYLSNICRCCGFEQNKDDELISKISSKVSKYCSIYEYLNFKEENNKVYPLYICSKCLFNFENQYADYYMGKSSNIKVQIAKFEEHQKENCAVCSYRISKENSDPLYFNAKHMKLLSKFCRMCKTLSVKFKSQENHKCSSSFNKLFDFSVKDLFNKENIYVYPQYFCEECCNVKLKLHLGNLLKLELNFANFEMHDPDCIICKEFSICTKEISLKSDSSIHNTTLIGSLLVKKHESVVSRDISQDQLKYGSKTTYKPNNLDIDKYTSEALKLHKENLTNFCRLCALPQNISNKKMMVPKCSALLVDCFAIFFRVNLTSEDPDIYPPSICMQCCYKLQVNLKARLKKKKAPHKLILPYFFENYQHQCKVCLYRNHFETSKLQDASVHDNLFCTAMKRKHDCSAFTDERLPLKRIKSCSLLPKCKTYGLPIEQLSSESKNEGVKYSCRNCSIISDKPVIAECQHLYCESCSKLFIAGNNICFDETCHNLLDDCTYAGLWIQNKIAKLYFVCRSWKHCNFKGKLKDTINHEATCQNKKKLTESFSNLADANGNTPFFMKSEQLTMLKSAVAKFCNENQKDLKASLSYLLWEQFNEEGNIQAAEYIMSLRNTEYVKWDIFSIEESLALKCMFLKTSEQYEMEFMYFKSNYEMELFKPIKEVEEIALNYLPNAVCFNILDFFGNILLQKESSNEFLINTFDKGSAEKLQIPVIGVYFNFIEAVANTIYELSNSFSLDINGADNQIAFVELKDGMQISQEISLIEKLKQIKFFRASFCILTIYCFVNGKKKTVFKCDLPNLYKNNRTFFIACCPDTASANVEAFIINSSTDIENNKSLLKHRLIDIKLSNGKFSHFYIKVFSSMYDDKLDKLIHGFSAPSLCRHCDSGKGTWLANIKDKASYRSNFDYLETNDAGLSVQETLVQLKLNLKSSQYEISCIYLNALYCDFTFAETIKEIIVHETANIFKNITECSTDEKQKYDDMVKIVDEYFHNYFGLSLLEIEKMSVSSISKFLETASTDKALELIINTIEQRQKIQQLLHLLSKIRTIYNNIKPSSTDIVYFKRNAVKFSRYLLDNFKYCSSTDLVSCLHKICEYGQNALLVEPHSIGVLSSEGLQNSYLLFKKIWKTKINAEVEQKDLAEVLKDSWLHTSPKLQVVGSAIMSNYRCTCCGLNGHSVCICPINDQCEGN